MNTTALKRAKFAHAKTNQAIEETLRSSREAMDSLLSEAMQCMGQDEPGRNEGTEEIPSAKSSKTRDFKEICREAEALLGVDRSEEVSAPAEHRRVLQQVGRKAVSDTRLDQRKLNLTPAQLQL